MPFALDTYVATAGQTDFTITFPYQAQEDVEVYNNDIQYAADDYTFPNASTVRFDTGASAGDAVSLRRNTSQSARDVDFTAGPLTEADLDNANIQNFYMAQEALDKTDLATDLFVVRDAEPSNPVHGTAWYNTATGRLYVYYVDPDTPQWIEIGGNYSTSAANALQSVYTPAGTGAVDSDVQTKLRESVSVKDFGATGDGTTDDTAAIQAGIDAIVAGGGGGLHFPTGTYKTTSQLTAVDSSLSMYGDGIGCSILQCDDKFMTVTNSASPNKSFQLRDMSVTSTTVGTKAGLTVTGSSALSVARSQVLITRVAFHGSVSTNSFSQAIHLVSCSDSNISSVSIVGDRDDWTVLNDGIRVVSSVDVVITGCRMYWGTYGIRSQFDVEGVLVSKCHIVGFEHGWWNDGSGGNAYLGIELSHFNTNQTAVRFSTTDASGCKDATIVGSNFYHNVPSNSGIGGATDYNWVGVYIEGAGSRVANTTIQGSLTKTDIGVRVGAASDNMSVNNNRLSGCSTAGVQVDSGATNVRVVFNTGGTAAFTDAGTKTYLAGNESTLWSSQVHAGATLLSGTTSIAVNHTLDSTPNLQDITITPRGTLGSANSYWVSNVTSTQFTINTDANPGTNVAFSWQANTENTNQ